MALTAPADAPATQTRTIRRQGRDITVRMPRGYRFDPGPQATMTWMASPVSVIQRFEACPRCGAPCEQEPAFSHCRMCGRYFPVSGASLNAQREYEVFAAYSTLVPERDTLPASIRL